MSRTERRNVAAHHGARLAITMTVVLTSMTVGVTIVLGAEEASPSARPVVVAPSAPADDLAALEAELEGTYETPWHPVELEFAAVDAAGLERPGDPAWEEGMASAATIRQVMRFDHGVLTNYCAVDGGALEICWEGSYRLLDDHTIEATEGPFRTLYEFTLRDGILAFDVVSAWRDGLADPVEMVAHTAIFETLPFTRIP